MLGRVGQQPGGEEIVIRHSRMDYLGIGSVADLRLSDGVLRGASIFLRPGA